MLDLARRARGEDRLDYAALLTQLATEARQQAADMERRGRCSIYEYTEIRRGG